MSQMSPLERAVQDIKNGKIVIVYDDPSRENEGDFVMAAQYCTPEHMNFIIRNSSGIVCLPLTREIAVKSNLTLMTTNNTDPNRTNFTISIDAENCTTGVSAHERAITVQAIVSSLPVRSPGHMFPLVAADGLLKERRGHTEASVALCKLAQCQPISVIAECMNPDGSMMRYEDCVKFAQQHNMSLVTVAEIDAAFDDDFDDASDCGSVARICTTNTTTIPITFRGDVQHINVTVYKDPLQPHNQVVHLTPSAPLLSRHVRIHSECFTAHVLHSCKCDCEQQFDEALAFILSSGGHLFVVLNHEGRGIGLFNKLQAYHLQSTTNVDTFVANQQIGCKEEARDWTLMKDVLCHLNLYDFEMITNNYEKLREFAEFNPSQLAMPIQPNVFNAKYLADKAIRSAKIANKARIVVVSTLWNRTHINEFWKRFHAYDLRIAFTEIVVPGAYEIPATVARVAKQSPRQFDAVVCIGAIVKGTSKHFEYISKSVFQGLMNVSIEHTDIPIINGILTVLNEEQIVERYELATSWI